MIFDVIVFTAFAVTVLTVRAAILGAAALLLKVAGWVSDRSGDDLLDIARMVGVVR